VRRGGNTICGKDLVDDMHNKLVICVVKPSFLLPDSSGGRKLFIPSSIECQEIEAGNSRMERMGMGSMGRKHF
jgi:hypothetical protein